MRFVSVRGVAWRGGRALAVAFVVVNALAVVYANRLPQWSRRWTTWAEARWDQPLVRAIDWTFFGFGWYPFLAGLDQRYSMFSTVARDEFVWRFYVVDAAGARREIAGASDHKAGKLYLNLYPDEAGRRRYASYLCRTAPSGGAAPWDHLDWEWWFHGFRARADAAAAGTHWRDEPHLWKTERFPCLG